jgi:2'-5' RNA ligase
LPRRRPNVLAVELHDHDAALAEVQALVSCALEEGGWYQPETRPFFAHVTVARVRKGARVSRDPLPAPPSLSMRAATVVLYRSRLSSTGARYEPLARFDLGSVSGYA